MIGFIGTSLQLQSIMTAHNHWLSNTRSIPYWTTSVFSSTATELVFGSPFNCDCLERRLFDECSRSLLGRFYSLARIHGKCLLLTRIHVNCLLSQKLVLSKRWLTMDFCSGSAVPVFRRHATIINNKQEFDSEDCVGHTVITALQRIKVSVSKIFRSTSGLLTAKTT
jgi:hypothetical protein